MSEPILKLENLSVNYGGGAAPLRALNEVTLSLRRGGCLGVVGESGSGKSSLALAIMGLLGKGASIDSGRIEFDGADLLELSEGDWAGLRGQRIGLVFQDPFTTLNPALTIFRLLSEPLKLHRGLSGIKLEKEARRLLLEVGISDPERVLAAYAHALSGGMKQRILIALALAGNPDLLILDEPTTALDVTIEAQILDLLAKLRKERQLTMIFISHNLNVVAQVVEDVCVLYAGKIVEIGPKESIFNAPNHPYTKGLLASMVQLSSSQERLDTIAGRLPDLRIVPAGCYFEPRCPFRETRCNQPQDLISLNSRHQSRCWKAETLHGVPWNASGVEKISKRRCFGGDPLLVASDIKKTFSLKSGLRALRFNKSGGFPITYSPESFTAVDQVSLSIRAGETVGLVGESGSGKSTLARCLIRLIEPDEGKIELDGNYITSSRSAQRRNIARIVQFVFQNPDSSLNPRKTVRQILSRPLRLYGSQRDTQIESEILRLLDMVRLSSAYLDRYPNEMSGGEKQRIGIARALAAKPKLLICDEAVSALDVSVQASILNLFSDLREELGLSYLFITHDLSVVRHIADRVAVMYRGSIVEICAADQLIDGACHPYTKELLSSVPALSRS